MTETAPQRTAARRRERFSPRGPNIAFLAVVPSVVMMGALVLVFAGPKFGLVVSPVMIIVFAGVVLLPGAWLVYRASRFVNAVAKTDGFMCLNCHYDLHGLADEGDCPECGDRYSRSVLERRWGLWLASQSKNKLELGPRLVDSATGAPPMPPMPKPRAPNLAFLTVIPMVVGIQLCLIGALLGVKHPRLLPLVPILPIAMFVLAIWNYRRVARVLRAVRSADGLLCLRCRGVLDSVDSENGVCRQCGARFSKAGVRKRWRQYQLNGHFGG